MDSALKQRLIGAAVLVALAVIFLPMLLDRPPPEPGTAAVRLDIPPAPERAFETRTLPLEPPAAASDTAAVVEREPLATVDAQATPRVDARPEDSAPAQSGDPAAMASDAVTQPAATAPAPDPAAAAAPAPAAPPEPPPAPVRDGQFVVNLGSFANQANARALLQRLQAAGLAAYAESIQVDGKPALRLRAGPYAVRGEAEAARVAARRVEAGLPAAVVSLDADAAATEAARSGFAVQVGAFRDLADARQLRDRLRAGGMTAFMDQVDTDQGRMHRVRVGPETRRERAEALKDTLKERFQLDGLVVTHP